MPIRKMYYFDQVVGARVGRLNQGINTTFIPYLVGSTLIDCGPSNQWPAVAEFLSDKTVKQLLITHHHEDHSGNAAHIAERFNLVPYAPTLSQTKLATGFRTPFIQRRVWGSPIPVNTQPLPEEIETQEGLKIIAVHTPGHAKDLTCFYLPEKRWLFSGDLYISRQLRLMRRDENLSQLMASIQKILQYDFEVLFCPHRGIVENGKQAMQDKLDYLRSLCENAQSLAEQGYRPKQISRQLLGKEEMISYVSGFDIAKINLIRQALTVDL